MFLRTTTAVVAVVSAVLVLAAVASRDRSLEVTQVGFEKN